MKRKKQKRRAVELRMLVSEMEAAYVKGQQEKAEGRSGDVALLPIVRRAITRFEEAS